MLPRTYAVYRRLIADAEAQRPDVFVAIDFPDFNFRLAHAMRKRGVPVVYYISPQLWAWRPGRMKTMQRIADRVLVIFPFEEAIYRRAGVPVEWVGHPLLDVVDAPRAARGVSRAARARSGAAGGRAPARQPEQRGARDPAGPAATPRGSSTRALPAAQFVLARAPHLPDELFAPLAAMAARRSR